MNEQGEQERRQPTGIPQWLEQFLNSQGGMQGLLYQVGGIQGLLQLIQQQAQQAQQPNPNPNGIAFGQDPTGLSARDRGIADPYGWWDYIQQREAARPQTMYQPNTGVEGFIPGVTPGRFEPRSSGNIPQGTQINIPTLEALQQQYPYLTSPLAAQGLQPLTPRYTAYGGNGVRLPTDPAIAANISPRAVNPYYSAATAGQLGDNQDFNRFITPEEYAALRNIPANTRGLALEQYLPQSLQGQGTPEQIKELQGLFNQYRTAFTANPSDMFARQQMTLANQALQSAQYGPMWQSLQSMTASDLPKRLASNADLMRPPKPMTKAEYATQYGYADRTGRFPNFANIQQTLRAAGWEPSMGFGPQESFGLLSNGQERPAGQQQMLNDLLYSISPRGPKLYGAGTEFPTFGAYWADLHKDQQLPEAPDPFAGMQSAINRDAYVNETLGGGFYGGLIPEEDARNTFGSRTIGGTHDPHFATPQLRLNPLPGQDPYDTYAGWASDQGAAFGTAPWAVDSAWGHAQGYDNPRNYQQPPAPGTAFQPTPQFGQGGVNTFAGTQGWGNTSRNGQQNAFGGTSSTQQQPMTFGTSPWNNPWGMR